MHLSPSMALAILCSYATLTAAAPLTATPLASKHNIYLSTCTRRPTCLLIICNNPTPFTAAAYYANGATTTSIPTELATITDPASAWEGTPRQGIFRTGIVSSAIDSGAKRLAKGEIAGQAKLGTEDFVCFKDGQTVFTGTEWDGLELRTVDCLADYWCASTS